MAYRVVKHKSLLRKSPPLAALSGALSMEAAPYQRAQIISRRDVATTAQAPAAL